MHQGQIGHQVLPLSQQVRPRGGHLRPGLCQRFLVLGIGVHQWVLRGSDHLRALHLHPIISTRHGQSQHPCCTCRPFDGVVRPQALQACGTHGLGKDVFQDDAFFALEPTGIAHQADRLALLNGQKLVDQAAGNVCFAHKVKARNGPRLVEGHHHALSIGQRKGIHLQAPLRQAPSQMQGRRIGQGPLVGQGSAEPNDVFHVGQDILAFALFARQAQGAL